MLSGQSLGFVDYSIDNASTARDILSFGKQNLTDSDVMIGYFPNFVLLVSITYPITKYHACKPHISGSAIKSDAVAIDTSPVNNIRGTKNKGTLSF